MPIVWLGRLLGIPFQERVAGSSLLDQLSASAYDPKLAVFLFGGLGNAGEAACAALDTTSDGLRSVGALNPGYGSVEQMSAPELIDRINSANADFLIVALGARKGHLWIERNRLTLKAPVISHLGAAVNFLAGTLVRAPKRVQQFGGEWLWRIGQEPKLIRRYAADAFFLISELLTAVTPILFWQVTARLRRIDSSLSLTVTKLTTDSMAVALAGSLIETTVPELNSLISEKIWNQRKRLTIDLAGVKNIDCRGFGYLYELIARSADVRVAVVGAHGHLLRVFRWHRAELLLSGIGGTDDSIAPIGAHEESTQAAHEPRRSAKCRAPNAN